jgi:hypothetical protein
VLHSTFNALCFCLCLFDAIVDLFNKDEKHPRTFSLEYISGFYK